MSKSKKKSILNNNHDLSTCSKKETETILKIADQIMKKYADVFKKLAQ